MIETMNLKKIDIRCLEAFERSVHLVKDGRTREPALIDVSTLIHQFV